MRSIAFNRTTGDQFPDFPDYPGEVLDQPGADQKGVDEHHRKTSSGSLAFTGPGPDLWLMGLSGVVLMTAQDRYCSSWTSPAASAGAWSGNPG